MSASLHRNLIGFLPIPIFPNEVTTLAFDVLGIVQYIFDVIITKKIDLRFEQSRSSFSSTIRKVIDWIRNSAIQLFPEQNLLGTQLTLDPFVEKIMSDRLTGPSSPNQCNGRICRCAEITSMILQDYDLWEIPWARSLRIVVKDVYSNHDDDQARTAQMVKNPR